MDDTMFETNDDLVTDAIARQLKNIVRDFFYQNIAFAMRQEMDNYKISAFFSILKKVYLDSVAHMHTITESFHQMKQLLVDHSVHQPPFKVEIFNLDDVRNISEYVHNT